MDLSQAYDYLYEKAEQLFRKYDICGLSIGDGKCHGNREPEKTGRGEDRCCKDCENLVKGNGCSVQSLCCKMWVCGTVAIKASMDPKLKEALFHLRSLHEECYKLGLPVGAGFIVKEKWKSKIVSIGFRKGKEETLETIEDLRKKGKIS